MLHFITARIEPDIGIRCQVADRCHIGVGSDIGFAVTEIGRLMLETLHDIGYPKRRSDQKN